MPRLPAAGIELPRTIGWSQSGQKSLPLRGCVALVRVRRVYVVPASWDNEGSETVVPEPEMWCVSCCSQYPNDPAPVGA